MRSKRPTKAELDAERAKWDGLTSPEADCLWVACRYKDGGQRQYKSVKKLIPKFIAMGFWDPSPCPAGTFEPEAGHPTEKGLRLNEKLNKEYLRVWHRKGVSHGRNRLYQR